MTTVSVTITHRGEKYAFTYDGRLRHGAGGHVITRVATGRIVRGAQIYVELFRIGSAEMERYQAELLQRRIKREC